MYPVAEYLILIRDRGDRRVVAAHSRTLPLLRPVALGGELERKPRSFQEFRKGAMRPEGKSRFINCRHIMQFIYFNCGHISWRAANMTFV